MDLAMIGLGKMGSNMTRRLLKDDHHVAVFDLDEDAVQQSVADGARGLKSLQDVSSALKPPRTVWIMVPSGDPTRKTVQSLLEVLQPGDLIVDGGNSNYQHTLEHARMAGEKGIDFVDVGTSGGVWGLAQGYSMMVGGTKDAVERLTPALKTLAPGPEKGWGHVGPVGSGHFVKMVHNGIEYGLMQAYAEGLDLLRHKREFELDLHQVAEIWRYGSVVRSWLLDLTAKALEQNPTMSDLTDHVSDSGEGRWTVQESIELACPIPVITAALQWRFRSRDDERFTDRLLSAMRHQFGGHAASASQSSS